MNVSLGSPDFAKFGQTLHEGARVLPVPPRTSRTCCMPRFSCQMQAYDFPSDAFILPRADCRNRISPCAPAEAHCYEILRHFCDFGSGGLGDSRTWRRATGSFPHSQVGNHVEMSDTKNHTATSSLINLYIFNMASCCKNNTSERTPLLLFFCTDSATPQFFVNRDFRKEWTGKHVTRVTRLSVIRPFLSGADATPPPVALQGVATRPSRLFPQFRVSRRGVAARPPVKPKGPCRTPVGCRG